MATISRCEYGGGANNFPLFVMIDGVTGARKRCRFAKTDLDENETIIVQHDEINFAAAVTEISGDGTQALLQQMLKRELFGLLAYSSCCSISHGASSDALGAIGSPSSLRSLIGPPTESCRGSATASPR